MPRRGDFHSSLIHRGVANWDWDLKTSLQHKNLVARENLLRICPPKPSGVRLARRDNGAGSPSLPITGQENRALSDYSNGLGSWVRSRQKASSTNRLNRSGGKRVARGLASTLPCTVCNPGVPARSSNSATS